MENRTKSAVILSILSSPAKLGIWNRLKFMPEDILNSISISQLITSEMISKRYSLDPMVSADLIIDRCEDLRIKIITFWDEEYPALLKEIDHPPLVLYIKGELKSQKTISIVGTRNSDKRSEYITKKISEDISKAGYTVVSGMALGIDRCAHMGALKAEGSTIAVLPSGVDIIYPAKNNDIYRMIYESKNSAIISEYPPGIDVYQKWAFVKRNRIISGLSEQVIIVQAPIKSGAMITAKYAIDQNRELLVCPGNAFDEKYTGCHELIKQGARLFSSMNDLFTESVYDSSGPELFETDKSPAKSNNPIEQKILEELKNGNIEIDKFIRKNNFPVDEVNEAVTLLEISGHITRRGNMIIKKE
ncbi:MAG: DNA-processing protein DprA [Leptospirales bacterium]|nr:DNA-processing protein DprA [Leptospirales bacterium]